MRLNVGIDGPVGAGKSTVADAVAAKLGILHLRTQSALSGAKTSRVSAKTGSDRMADGSQTVCRR